MKIHRPARPDDGADPSAIAGASPPFEALDGEHVIWSGRPSARGLARHVLRVNWIALYFAAFVIWGAYIDRSHGATIVATLRSALPLALLGGVVLLACHGLAAAWARTSSYVVTSERCVLRIGIALTGTLSIPWRSVASVSMSTQSDGTGDIALAPRRPNRLRFLNLYPHARWWRFARPEPMLLCVPHASAVGARIRNAIQAASYRDAAVARPASVRPTTGGDAVGAASPSIRPEAALSRV